MALAVTGNNMSSDLELRPDRTAGETALMLEAARAGRKYWEIAGDWTNVERAEYRLSASYSAAGDGPRALEHARACLAICARESAPAMETFFAQERIAHASALLDETGAARAAYDAAAACLVAIEDADDREYCKGELAKLQSSLRLG